MQKRLLAILLALALVLTGLAGCGKQETVMPKATVAKGRYVEQELTLPTLGYPLDMTTLEDGRLRLGLMTGEREYRFFTRETDDSWSEDLRLPESAKTLGDLDLVRLFRDGSVFLSGVEEIEDGVYQYHFAIVSPDGGLRELPITYPEADETAGYLLSGGDVTEDGRLMLLFSFDDLREINLTDGSLSGNLNECGLWVGLDALRCAGEDTFLLSDDGCARLRDGKQELLTDVLGEQLMAAAQSTVGTPGSSCLWQNQAGYLFFTTNEGLFSFVPGGSVTEELISADRSSLGDPSFQPTVLEGTEDGVFYILGAAGRLRRAVPVCL